MNKKIIFFVFTFVFIFAGVSVDSAKAVDDVLILNAQKESLEMGGMAPVRFPHKRHEDAVGKCNACHDHIFKKKRNTSGITMKDNMEGRFCGICHTGEVAFPLFNCKKCHVED